jgi:hypothetical protein
MLHAAALNFPHPAGGISRITAPLPSDVQDVLTSVGLEWPQPAAEQHVES